MQIIKLKKGLGLNVQLLNPDGRETAIMIHGMFGNLAQFYLTIAPLIAKNYKIVLYDLKSQGRSDKMETGYDLDTFASEVIELADQLDLEKFHLIGYSFGSLIALKCAMNYPERINKIVAIEVPDKAKEPMPPRGSYTHEYFMHFVHYLNTDIRENFFRSKRQMHNTFKMHEYIYNETTFVNDFNNEAEFQKHDFAKVTSPVLLAFGKKSVCFHEMDRIKNWIPFVDIYVEEGGHGFFAETIEPSANRIVEFLQSEKSFSNIALES